MYLFSYIWEQNFPFEIAIELGSVDHMKQVMLFKRAASTRFLPCCSSLARSFRIVFQISHQSYPLARHAYEYQKDTNTQTTGGDDVKHSHRKQWCVRSSQGFGLAWGSNHSRDSGGYAIIKISHPKNTPTPLQRTPQRLRHRQIRFNHFRTKFLQFKCGRGRRIPGDAAHGV